MRWRDAIYVANFGYNAPASIGQFIDDMFTTSAGWNVIVVGTVVGFLFAVVVLTISVVSFPLLLDRDVGAAVALFTSIRVVLANPVTMALWGLIVAALLVVGSLPFLLGLTVVMPVLGHATWHLYRKAVESDACRAADYQPDERRAQRYAADFPVRAVSDAPLEHHPTALAATAAAGTIPAATGTKPAAGVDVSRICLSARRKSLSCLRQ